MTLVNLVWKEGAEGFHSSICCAPFSFNTLWNRNQLPSKEKENWFPFFLIRNGVN